MTAYARLLFALLLLGGSGCAVHGYRYTVLAQAREPPARAGDAWVSAREADEDLDLLRYALDRGYGGRGYVPEAAWKDMQRALRALSLRPTTVAQLCDGIGDALFALPDAHLSARRRLSGAGPVQHCGTLLEKDRRTGKVGANRAGTNKETAYTIEVIEVGGTRIGVLAIRSFPQDTDPRWKGFENAESTVLRSDAALIDLRGNGGGDDSRGYDLAKKLIDAPVWSQAKSVHTRVTPETITLWMNMLDRMSRGEDGRLAPHIVHVYEETERRRAQATKPGQPQWIHEEQPAFVLRLGARAYDGPVAILVDAECASSCESTLEVLRRYPRSKVFGQRTGGYVHFGNVGALTLPHTGIRVSIPTKYKEYPGGRSYDKVGFEPDVLVPDGEDAFDAASAWLTAYASSPLVSSTSRRTRASSSLHD